MLRLKNVSAKEITMMMALENVFYVRNQQLGISLTKNVLDVL